MWRPEDDLQEAISTCRLWRLNSGHQAWQLHFSLPNRHTVPLFFIDGISSAFCRPGRALLLCQCNWEGWAEIVTCCLMMAMHPELCVLTWFSYRTVQSCLGIDCCHLGLCSLDYVTSVLHLGPWDPYVLGFERSQIYHLTFFCSICSLKGFKKWTVHYF